jgi:hypothetical protein
MSCLRVVRIVLLSAGLAAAAFACGAEGGDRQSVEQAVKQPEAIDARRELLVNALTVVEDPTRTTSSDRAPGGAWTFGKQMAAIAGGREPSAFVLGWLRSWERPTTVNGFACAARPAIRDLVINPWLVASGCRACTPSASDDCAASDDACSLDFRKEPFRLLAIVNRLDLRNVNGPGRRTAGEGRFVYGVLGLDPATGSTTRTLQFTVILESELPGLGKNDARNWAKRWHKLGATKSDEYNARLNEVTDGWALPGACPDKPNGSCINQIRTDEASLDPAKRWELREFRLDAQGRLRQVTTFGTPDASFDGTAALASFIDAHAADLIANRKVDLPAAWAASVAPVPPGVYWSGAVADPEARHAFSLSTCNGCHAGETATKFTHVKPRAAGVEAALSAFLTGVDPTTGAAVTVRDPVSGVERSFNDLARRALDLDDVLTKSDAAFDKERPTNRTE